MPNKNFSRKPCYIQNIEIQFYNIIHYKGLTKNWGCNSDGNFPVAMIIYNCGEMIIVEKIVEKIADKISEKNCA